MATNAVVLEGPASVTNGDAYGAGLSRKRVYILPTRPGTLYAFMLLVMLLGATNYNNSMGFILCFFLTGLGLVCMLHTYRNLSGLVLTTGVPGPVFAGDTAEFPVGLDNRANISRHALEFSAATGKRFWQKRAAGAEWRINFDVDADGRDSVFLPLKTTRRGYCSMGRVRIAGRFPLGLFQAWSYYSVGNKCMVYPNPAGSADLPQRALAEASLVEGSMHGVDDFGGFKKYAPGDSIKMIAWKSLAREQELMVKQFVGGGAGTLILSWQSVDHLHTIEARLSQLCKWVLIAEQQGFSYGLELPHMRLEPQRGGPHKHRCLEALALFKP